MKQEPVEEEEEEKKSPNAGCLLINACKLCFTDADTCLHKAS